MIATIISAQVVLPENEDVVMPGAFWAIRQKGIYLGKLAQKGGCYPR